MVRSGVTNVLASIASFGCCSGKFGLLIINGKKRVPDCTKQFEVPNLDYDQMKLIIDNSVLRLWLYKQSIFECRSLGCII